jgi:hypothetical protein
VLRLIPLEAVASVQLNLARLFLGEHARVRSASPLVALRFFGRFHLLGRNFFRHAIERDRGIDLKLLSPRK